MMRLLLCVLCAARVLPCAAQDATPELARILSFETTHQNGFPGGWSGNPVATISVDDKVVHTGKWSVRLARPEGAGGTFSVIAKSLPMDFAGKSLTLRGYLRTENVSEYSGLWAREDGAEKQLAFDNMQQRQLKGTTEWTQYSIVLPVHPDARQLVYGVLTAGTGTVWADDLELLVDGKPIWEAPKAEPVLTALDRDHEFDGRSGLQIANLSASQAANLALLGKVWGFLKYHHPAVVSGQRHWDFDLFRVLPKVLSAADRSAANQVLLDWITGLGPVASCTPCATLDENELQLRPDLAWLSDEKALGSELSKRLLAIHANRIPDKQFYVSLAAGVHNPSFDHELSYTQSKSYDAGFQLLALYRFWNIVQYWSPNRDIVGENWDDVLTTFIPRVTAAKSTGDYAREMMALIALDHDTHANLWSSLAFRPPEGACQLPITVRFVENRAVVTGYAADSGKSSGLKVGDVITQLDGVPVAKLVETWSPYYATSNEPTRLRDIARSMTRGACGDMSVGIRNEKGEAEVKTERLPMAGMTANAGITHDLPGETFRMLSDDVAYLKLSSVKAADVARHVDNAAKSKGLIIDIRNYPSEFVVFALGELLAEKETQFARFTQADLSNPGAFHFRPSDPLRPRTPHYAGKIVVLVDEVSVSQAEYTAMAFRSAPRTTVIGSTTAGADGNVSQIPLPGGLSSLISGLGVFYPDKKPTQRVGIIPDVEVKPTIAGIRAGRDELMEEAIRRILGTAVTPEAIAKMLAR